ncbi:MAG: cell division protein ZapA [Halothiobacillaceae bacterium]|jgi:cell division protein ZapA|nr:cell division protein ZapA [Halothiobacillaceae bacterium]MDY0050136.1 cell division protein ZapA [Halothiobacillaceae bacterium]
MSHDAHHAVDIHILDKEYRIACPEGERDALLRASRYLDARMREIRNSGKVIGNDRVAVMAALNIAHEMLNQREGASQPSEQVTTRLGLLETHINEALETCRLP